MKKTELVSRFKCFTAAAFMMFLASCTHEKPSNVPSEGSVVYDLIYSGAIADNSLVGKMLPSKVNGIYNGNGFKLSTQAGLGMFKLDIVTTVFDSYIDFDINGDKFLLPFSEIFQQEDYDKYESDVKNEFGDATEVIGGYESHKMVSRAKTPDGGNVTIETYYVPVDNFGRQFKDCPVTHSPGLVTAMKIMVKDSNMVFMLSDLKESKVDDSVFARPSGFKQIKREDMAELVAKDGRFTISFD